MLGPWTAHHSRLTATLCLIAAALPGNAQLSDKAHTEKQSKTLAYIRSAEAIASPYPNEPLIANGELRIAKVACGYSVDEARSLLSLAYKQIQTLAEKSRNTLPNAKLDKIGAYYPPSVSELQQTLFEDAVLCDPALLKRLRAGNTDSDPRKPLAQTHAARTALDSGDIEQAVDLAQGANALGFSSHEQILYYIFFLQKLREKSPTQADQLFSQLLSSLGAQASLDANEVLAAGHYVLSTNENTTPGAIKYRVVNNRFMIVANVSRPGASAALVKSFLSFAVNVLSRTTEDSSIQRSNFIAAYELLPVAAAYDGPSYASLLAITERLSSGLPSEATNQAELDKMMGAESPPPSISDLERVQDPNKRALLYLAGFASYIKARQWTEATTIADRMSSSELKSQMMDLIVFRQAASCLEDRKIDCAEERINQVHTPLNQTLLLIGLSQLEFQSNETATATNTLDRTVAEIFRTPLEARPSLLLSCLRLSDSIDVSKASTLLEQYISEVNKLDHSMVDSAATRPQLARHFYEYLSIGNISIPIGLRVPGFSVPPFADAIRASHASGEAAFSLLDQFSDPSRRSEALPDILDYTLHQMMSFKHRSGVDQPLDTPQQSHEVSTGNNLNAQ